MSTTDTGLFEGREKAQANADEAFEVAIFCLAVTEEFSRQTGTTLTTCLYALLHSAVRLQAEVGLTPDRALSTVSMTLAVPDSAQRTEAKKALPEVELGSGVRTLKDLEQLLWNVVMIVVFTNPRFAGPLSIALLSISTSGLWLEGETAEQVQTAATFMVASSAF